MSKLACFVLCATAATALSITPISAIAGNPQKHFHKRPHFIRGEILHAFYDGVSNDLLTGGLGKTGLQTAPPNFADALNPTAAELRTRAIYVNYRAIVDATPAGGYGTLYGPNIDINGNPTLGEGLVAGDEY